MNLPVILAIAGCAALLAGLFGGGIKAKEIVIPKLSTMPRIFSSLTGLVLIGIAIWVSQGPSAEVPPTQISPTEVPSTQVSPTNVPPRPTMIFTEDPHTSIMATSVPPQTDPNSRGVFVHYVISKNMFSAASVLEHSLSFDPKALLFVTSNYNPRTNDRGLYNNHLIAAWYTKLPGRTESEWTIVNQDMASFYEGAAFNVQILSEGENAFLHLATTANISKSWTVIEHPLASDPNALVFAMPAWSPNGGSANDVNHPVGVWYTGSHWAIFNMDGAPMREGTGFNVEILSPSMNAFVQSTTSSNIDNNWTKIDNPLAYDANKLLFVMPRGSPDDNEVNNSQPIGVWYTGQWTIFNQNEKEAMPAGIAFNVLILDAK